MASFALYEDGLTLFGRRDVTSKDLLAVRLDPDALSAFLAELPIGEESGDSFHCVIDGDDLAEVEAVYNEELPVEIQGEVWDINYRLPIPNEGAVRLNRALWTKRG